MDEFIPQVKLKADAKNSGMVVCKVLMALLKAGCPYIFSGKHVPVVNVLRRFSVVSDSKWNMSGHVDHVNFRRGCQ